MHRGSFHLPTSTVARLQTRHDNIAADLFQQRHKCTLAISRMNRTWTLLGCCILAAGQFQTASSAEPARRNILLIAVDDLNDWVGPLGGHPQVKTPHLDRLAKRGTTFLNAHCQAPLCNPSRASVLTSLRPSTTGIHGLTPGIRQVERTQNTVTLPQHFAAHGYFTATSGKVFHDGSIKPVDQKSEFQVWGPAPGMPRPAKRFANLPGTPHPLMDWGPYPESDEEQADWKIATAAIAQLQSAPKDKPFLIATGFRLPHVPCFASQKWFDLYPADTLELPPVKENDRADTPAFSWFLHWTLPEPRLSLLKKQDEWRPLVRAYLASISFMDSQVGRVLDALRDSGRESNTVVVLWSDHGWHLGEKGITGKNSLWERATRVPLIFAGPGVAMGAKCSSPSELLDIFSTIAELCGLPKGDGLEGHSLVPQLKNASAPREWPAITTHNQGNHAVRTVRWRYIRYADGSEELYDLKSDQNEWTNLAGDLKSASVLAEHRRWLPRVDVPAAPGSQHRVLSYDPKTKIAIWEGKVIVPADKEQ